MQILASKNGFPVYTGLKANICSFDVNIKKRQTFVQLLLVDGTVELQHPQCPLHFVIDIRNK